MINLGAPSVLSVAFHTVTDSFMSGLKNATGALSGFSKGGLAVAGGALAVFAGVELMRATAAAQRFEDNIVRLSKVAGRDWGEPIARQIRNMSSEMPIAAEAMFDVAESALRLGVRGADDINHFVRTMSKVGAVTDMTAQTAAENFARMATVMQIPISEIDKLAATANQLSDTMATSFSEVVRTSGELAPVMVQMGLLPEQVVAFAAAQNEVNVSVQRGAQRLRSFVQQLQQTNRAANIAPALNMTVEAFREMLEEDPSGMIIRIAEALQEGGSAARQLTEAFDSAAGQGIQALSQNLVGLDIALEAAKEEMVEGGSLARQFSEFMGSASARSQELENNLERLRSEIGENLLPLKSGITSFFAALVSGLSDARRSANALLRLQERLPDFIVEDLISAWAEREGMTIDDMMPLQRDEFGSVSPARMRQNFAASLEDSNLIDYIEKLSSSLDQATGEQDRFLRSVMDGLPEMIASGASIGQMTQALGLWALEIENSRREIEKFGESGDDEPVGGLVERLRGMNLEFAKSVLAERFGLALSDVTDEVARMLLSLRQSEVAFFDGDRAARDFELTLQGVPKAMREIITAGEENLRINEVLRNSTEQFESTLGGLEERQLSLTETEEDAFKRRINSIEALMPWQRQMLLMAYRHTVEVEKQADASEQFDNIIKGLRSSIDELNKSERERLATRIRGLGLGEDEIKQALELLDTLDQLNERRRKEQELDRMRRRLDVTSLENRFRMLDQTISGVADNVVDLFSMLNDENRKFGRAMQDTIRQIGRDFARMFLRMQMMRALEGTDWFQNFVGLGTAAASASSGGGLFSTGSIGSSVANAASQQQQPTFSVQVNYEINSLDPRTVTDILTEQAPTIATNVAKQFSRSRYLREQANA